MAGLHLKDRPRAARVALYTPKLRRKPRTVAMIMNADTAKRFSLHMDPALVNNHVSLVERHCSLCMLIACNKLQVKMRGEDGNPLLYVTSCRSRLGSPEGRDAVDGAQEQPKGI